MEKSVTEETRRKSVPMPYWLFIDWADVEKSGICTAYNAIFYRTLECLHQLAEFKGDQYTVNLTSELRSAMQAAFAAGYTAVDFVTQADRCWYILCQK